MLLLRTLALGSPLSSWAATPSLHLLVQATTATAMSSAKFKIYTKTGDKGTSALYNGQRLPKDDGIFQALGDVDELNSAVGVAREFCDDRHKALLEQLEVVQSRLLDVGSAVATPADKSSESKLQRVRFDASSTEQLEKWLDAMCEELPPLRNFILPSGGKAAGCLHLARSVCRRAERSVVPLVREGLCDHQVGIYLNRLSDYLFTAARFAAAKEEQPEVVYKKMEGSDQRELVSS